MKWNLELFIKSQLVIVFKGTTVLIFSLFIVKNVNATDLKPVTFAGSSTIMPIMEDMKPIFEKNGYDVQIQGGGSSAGLKSVKMKMADIGMVSRALKPNEQAFYQSYAFASDLVTIIVHKDNTLNDIVSEKVRAIYSGQTSQWGNGERITVISKENGRATRRVFEENFSLTGKVRRDAIIIGANGQAIVAVEGDKNAIAYISYNSAQSAIDNGSPVKILALDGVEPTIETAQQKLYMLTRDLNLVYLSKGKERALEIFKVLKTPDARAVLSKHRVVAK